MSFLRLEENHDIKPFKCSNDGLNDFLFKKSKEHQIKLLAVTYIFEDELNTVAYYNLLNDRISIQDLDNGSQYKKIIQNKMPADKKYKSYPAVKIGRLGVNIAYERNGIGRSILDYIKYSFVYNNKTGCKFITVDARKESIEFYTKNGFDFLTTKDKDDDSRLMFFDLAIFNGQNTINPS